MLLPALVLVVVRYNLLTLWSRPGVLHVVSAHKKQKNMGLFPSLGLQSLLWFIWGFFRGKHIYPPRFTTSLVFFGPLPPVSTIFLQEFDDICESLY